MKKYLKKVNITGSVLMAILFFASCNKDDSQDFSEEGAITVTELKVSDETDLILEDVINIGEEVYATDEITMTSKANYISDFLPDCVTITTVVTTKSK